MNILWRFQKYNSFYPVTTPSYSKLNSKLGHNCDFLKFFLNYLENGGPFKKMTYTTVISINDCTTHILCHVNTRGAHGAVPLSVEFPGKPVQSSESSSMFPCKIFLKCLFFPKTTTNKECICLNIVHSLLSIILTPRLLFKSLNMTSLLGGIKSMDRRP